MGLYIPSLLVDAYRFNISSRSIYVASEIDNVNIGKTFLIMSLQAADKTYYTFYRRTAIGVGRFRILVGGARFRIFFGGGARGGKGGGQIPAGT